VAGGDALLAPAVTRRLIAEFARRPTPRALPPALADLTPRELEVLRLVARGHTNAQIAAKLVVGEATVKPHVGNLLGKLGLQGRVLAYESGLVEPGGAA
jgi:DNA-binding NarL/FixJ family response regulator